MNGKLMGVGSVLLCFGILTASLSVNAQLTDKQRKRIQASNELFDRDRVLRIDIEIPEDGLELLRTYEWQFGGPALEERPKAKAVVREGGVEYRDVAVHLKGAAGSFRSIDAKPAMTLNFDKHVKGQEFHGMDKLYLNNSVQDPTYLNEKTTRELFLSAGIPTPRAANALVKLNGKMLGMYVLVEGFDKRFLRRHFDDVFGNLYDGGFVQDVDADLSVNSGDRPEEKSDLKALVEAAREPDLDRRLERLNNALDLNRFYSHLALDVMTWNWDGYAMNKNNYRLYQDRDQDKFIFIPHGLDQIFDYPQGEIYPPFQGLVARALLEIPGAQQALYERMNAMFGKEFKVDALVRRVDSLSAVLRPALEEAGEEALNRHTEAVDDYKKRITERGETLAYQLDGPNHVVQFAEDGTAPLAGWEAVGYFGNPQFDKRELEGRTLLEISANNQSSWGYWRTKVWLRKGRYRVDGMMKMNNVVPDRGDPRRGGCALRAGERPVLERHQGGGDWRALSYEFEVSAPFAETPVYCEFRAFNGQAAFDRDSLRLRRLP